MSYISNIIYDSSGHTGSIYYIRIVAQKTGYIWDDTNVVLAASPTWVNSDIILVEVGLTGEFPVVVPTDLPAGNYDVLVYKQVGSDPANTDDVKEVFTLKNGSIFGF